MAPTVKHLPELFIHRPGRIIPIHPIQDSLFMRLLRHLRGNRVSFGPLVGGVSMPRDLEPINRDSGESIANSRRPLGTPRLGEMCNTTDKHLLYDCTTH